MRTRAGAPSAGLLALSPLAAAVVYTLGLVVFAYGYSAFVGDDLSTFYALRRKPFGGYLLDLLGGQLVVLHRLVTYVIYRLWPMRFLPAVLILGALHLTSAFYLYRTLETMRPSRVNPALVAYYLTSVFIGIQLTWWSSGLTRVGYIALATIAIFHYLRHARTGRPRDLAIVAIAGVAAFGFYAKAILIPAYCVAVDAVSRDGRMQQDRRGRALRWATLAFVFVFGVAYSAAARALLPPAFRRLNTDLAYQIGFVGACFRVFVGSLADRPLSLGEPAPLWFVLVALSFVGYSFVRAPRTLVAWALLVALVVLNFLVVGISSRTLIWRTEMIVEYRHYFELYFFTVLLVGAVVHRLADAPEWRRVAAVDPRLTTAVVLVLLAAHAVVSTRALGRLLRTNELYATLPASRSYLENMRVDLDALSKKGGATPMFAEGYFPMSLDPLDFSFRRYSQLFIVFGADVRMGSPRDARYTVLDDGHIARLKRGRIVR